MIFEPTGRYKNSLRSFLKDNKINFTIFHRNKVHKYSGAKGLLGKNDNIDSKLLHEYVVHFTLAIKVDYSTLVQENYTVLSNVGSKLFCLKHKQ